MKGKVCCAGWGFRALDNNIYFKAAAEIGFRFVEMQIDSTRHSRYHLGLAPSEKELAACLKAANESNVKIAAVAGTNDFLADEHLLNEVESVKRQIEFTSALGAPILRIFAGWKAYHELNASSYARVSELLMEVGNYAAQRGITIAIENHGGITNTAAQMYRLLLNVDSENVGINYDPANFARNLEDPLAAYYILRNRVVYVHLKDVTWREGQMTTCAIGEGMIDWDLLIPELLVDYNGYVAIEYENTHDIMQGTRKCMKNLQKFVDFDGNI